MIVAANGILIDGSDFERNEINAHTAGACSGATERGAHVDPDPKFFSDLACKCLRVGFALLDFAAGKLPQTTVLSAS